MIAFTENPFTQEQLTELIKPLDPRFVSTRKGAGRQLRYLEGHDAIDQANRIFGYGNWGYKPLSIEQVVILDPVTGEAVGVEYKAIVELVVRGVVAPIAEIGSHPVAAWSIEEQVMGRRESEARYNKTKPDYDAAITWQERKSARNVIMEAHEMAKKGAVTDALKRCLRIYGNQFGNGLYGDGPVDLGDAPSPPAQRAQQQPAQQATTTAPSPGPITAEQRDKIVKLCKELDKKVPLPVDSIAATTLLNQLVSEYRERRRTTNPAVAS